MLMAMLSGAGAAGPPPAMSGCAATAAAALGDPIRAGEWLRRIAEQDDALRCRALQTAHLMGDLPVRLRLFPWGLVADQPPVGTGMSEIQAGYARLRTVADAVLGGVEVGKEK
jgi:hypothetical protein